MKYKYAILILIIILGLTYLVFSGLVEGFFWPKDQTALQNEEIQEGENLNILRVMTFNIHHGVGLEGTLEIKEIGRIIRDSQADLVGLNEVDRFMPRSRMMNQLDLLARQTQLDAYYGPTLNYTISQYGNGFLSKLPVQQSNHTMLPRFQRREKRNFIESVISFAGQEIRVIVTHLGLNPVERAEQLNFLAQRVLEIEEPLIVLGDFNTTPTAQVMKDFLNKTGLKNHSQLPSFPANQPDRKIDYILTSHHWRLVEPIQPLTTNVSDHLPLLAGFQLKK